MDELIILLIRGIVRLLGGNTQKRPSQLPQQWQPGPTAPQLPPEIAARLQQMQKGGQPQLKRRQTKRRPPPIPVAAPIFLSRVPLPVESIVTAAKPIPRHATSIGAFTNDTLKLTPAEFRKQIVMNEILQPPVALRDDRIDV